MNGIFINESSRCSIKDPTSLNQGPFLALKPFSFRPEILKNEMKVFFVKYNDPIYVKLEKLDIMIRLASEANIAQVLAELKE